MDLKPYEYISHLIIDSSTRANGTVFNFTTPLINFTGVERLAVDSYHMNDNIPDINKNNNQFKVSDNVNTYTITLPTGFYTYTTNPSGFSSPFDNTLQSTLNSQAGALGTWTVSYNSVLDQYTITCTNPFRTIVDPAFAQPVLECYGIYPRTTLSTTFVTGKASLIYSPMYYVCSDKLTLYNERDAHTNPKIGNVLFEVSVADLFVLTEKYTIKHNFETLKVAKWDAKDPISVVDIFVLDKWGNPLPDEAPYYSSYFIQLKFKCVRQYASQDQGQHNVPFTAKR